MLNKNLLLKVSSLLVIGAMFASAPALALAKEPKEKSGHEVTGNFAVIGTGNTGALTLPAAGWGSINLINYDGAGEQLTVDFNNINYVLPASTQGGSGNWNHVEFSLAPGTYNWTASVTGNDTVLNGTISVAAGKVTSIGFYDNLADTLNGDKNRDDAKGTLADKDPGVTSPLSVKVTPGRDTDDLLFRVSDMTAMAH